MLTLLQDVSTSPLSHDADRQGNAVNGYPVTGRLPRNFLIISEFTARGIGVSTE
jgi:hypothetical protein